MPDAIVVKGLTKNYGDFVALRGVSFTVEAGTIFGLLGPNGAGKTTVVRILATVLKPSGGGATILGTDVVRQPEWVRFDIGLAGQFAAVDEQLTGRENLRLVGRLAQLRPKLIPARADELLERFWAQRRREQAGEGVLRWHAQAAGHRFRARPAAPGAVPG